jgi:hypothetical protein
MLPLVPRRTFDEPILLFGAAGQPSPVTVRVSDMGGGGSHIGWHGSVDTGRHCPRCGAGASPVHRARLVRAAIAALPRASTCSRWRVRALLARESSTAPSRVSPTGTSGTLASAQRELVGPHQLNP